MFSFLSLKSDFYKKVRETIQTVRYCFYRNEMYLECGHLFITLILTSFHAFQSYQLFASKSYLNVLAFWVSIKHVYKHDISNTFKHVATGFYIWTIVFSCVYQQDKISVLPMIWFFTVLVVYGFLRA